MAIFELLDYIVNEVSFPLDIHTILRILVHINMSRFIAYLTFYAKWTPIFQPPPKLPGIFSAEFQDFVNKWYVGQMVCL